MEEILGRDANLSIPRYVRPVGNDNANNVAGDDQYLKKAWTSFETSGREFWVQMDELVAMLDGVVFGEENNA